MTRILPLVLAAVSVALYVLGRHGGAVAALAGAVILLVGRLRRSPSAGNAAPTGAPAPPAPPRAPLEGVVEVAGRPWGVREERRHGPGSQLLVLTGLDDPDAVMHIRPRPGAEAATLDDVTDLAGRPACRWFRGADGLRWQARVVVYTGEDNRDVELVKLISSSGTVLEGRYRAVGGLGYRTEDELRALPARLAAESGAPGGEEE